MPNIRLVIEYNGSRFHGWQVQPGFRTVQGELHRTLELILREQIRVIHASGRTDAGVHARAQVVNFHITSMPDLFSLRRSLSSLLRDDIAVLSADVVPDEFHSRGTATVKQYSYSILNRTAPPVLDKGLVWFVSSALNIEYMQEQAQAFIGLHDFTSFQGSDCGSDRVEKQIVESAVEWQEPYLRYRVIGSGFLKNMVRIMVGTLVDLGKDKLDLKSIRAILEQKDRRAAGVTAPAEGLYLDWVQYPDPFSLPKGQQSHSQRVR